MRHLLRAVLVVAVLLLVLLGWNYWKVELSHSAAPTVGTSGRITTEGARERGAEIAGKAAQLANELDGAVSDATLTAKIRSKMALDDEVESRHIDVTTSAGVVTLQGYVESETEHQKALRLARETHGVSNVIDHIERRRPDR